MSEIVEFTSKDGHLGFLVFDYVARLKREAASIGSQPISTRYKNLPASRHQKAAHNFLAAYKKRDREITASDLKSFVGIDANFISELILNRVDGISFEDAVRRHFELIGRPCFLFSCLVLYLQEQLEH